MSIIRHIELIYDSTFIDELTSKHYEFNLAYCVRQNENFIIFIIPESSCDFEKLLSISKEFPDVRFNIYEYSFEDNFNIIDSGTSYYLSDGIRQDYIHQQPIIAEEMIKCCI